WIPNLHHAPHWTGPGPYIWLLVLGRRHAGALCRGTFERIEAVLRDGETWLRRRANRIALVDPIIEAFRQQRRLLAIRPLNETLHHFPRRFSKRIIASMGFSHSLGP